MGPDVKVCYCYQVPLRKLWQFARRRRPQRASQMSECLGAGSGCGWCIPLLKRIFAQAREHNREELATDMSPEQYAAARQAYLDTGQEKNTF